MVVSDFLSAIIAVLCVGDLESRLHLRGRGLGRDKLSAVGKESYLEGKSFG